MAEGNQPDGLNQGANTGGNQYFDNLQRLIPAEVTAGFLAIHSLIPETANVWWVFGFAVVLVPLCALYARRFKATATPRSLAFTSLVAFPLWVLNIALYRIEWFVVNNAAFIPAALVIVVTLAAPFVADDR